MTRLPSLRLLFCCLVLGLWFSSSLASDVAAQTCTQQNSAPVNKVGWIKAAEVQVYIDPAIPGLDPVTGQDQRGAVIQAFNNWNGASGSDGNNSRVHYTIVNAPPTAGSNGFTVTSGTAAPGERATTSTFTDANGYTIGATTTLDSRVTDPAAIVEVISHEIGHPAGFGDCTSCSPTDSVMALGATDYNQVIGRPTSPTNCDNQALQRTDYPPCNPPVDWLCQTWDPNTCTCTHYSGGGSGGDPAGKYESDGCTDYYWCYFVSYDGGSTWQLYDMVYAGCFY
jgi:hypothetical protein